jgi:hypothetical protein
MEDNVELKIAADKLLADSLISVEEWREINDRNGIVIPVKPIPPANRIIKEYDTGEKYTIIIHVLGYFFCLAFLIFINKFV